MDVARASDAAPTAVTPAGRSGRNLPLAIATGVLLAAAFAGSLLWHPMALLALVYGFVVVALLELDGAFAERRVAPATPVAIGATAIGLFGAYLVGPVAQTLSLALLLLGAAVWVFLLGPRERAAEVIGGTLLIGVWVGFSASFAGLLLSRPDGGWLLTATIAIAVVTDIGAYAVGSAVGRHKLAPGISPGKTWEGLGGGVAAALLLAALLAPVLPDVGLPLALLLGAAVSAAAVAGDLAESLLKRDLGVKDLGRILPGHGGVMDRVDSILFALPAAYLVLRAAGVV